MFYKSSGGNSMPSVYLEKKKLVLFLLEAAEKMITQVLKAKTVEIYQSWQLTFSIFTLGIKRIYCPRLAFC